MISLILRSKIPVSEDAITAAMFDYVRTAREPAPLLRRMLEYAKPAPGMASAQIPEFDSVSVELWPVLIGGEPDVRVTASANGRAVARILVEAKLGAQKSGDGDVCLERGTGDQLARYLLAEAANADGTHLHLIYLTHHAACPRDDLAESCRHLAAAGRPDLSSRIRWLSWRDVEALLGHEPAARDVRELLRRTRMYRFVGLVREAFALNTVSPVFYSSGRRGRSHVVSTHRTFLAEAARLHLGDVRRWHYRRGRSRYDLQPVGPFRTSARFYKLGGET